MLRIIAKEEHGSANLRLEGVLAGPWVEEVARCWQATLARFRGPQALKDSPEGRGFYGAFR
jgi:hypothetical protein